MAERTRRCKARYECMDLHCEGLAARVVLSGLPGYMYDVERFASVFEARKHFKEELDMVRETLMTEPRGYHCTNLDFVVPAYSKVAVHGLIIAEQNAVYPLMSGHNTICTVTALVEGGLLTHRKEEINTLCLRPGVKCAPRYECFEVNFMLETPGGLIEIIAETNLDLCDEQRNGELRCVSVQFRNMPAFFAQSVEINCSAEHFNNTGLDFFNQKDALVKADIAFGGMFYCIVDVGQFNEDKLKICPDNGATLVRYGEMLKVACREQFPVEHPVLEGYPGPDIMVFTEFDEESKQHRNAVGAYLVLFFFSFFWVLSCY